MDITTVWSKGVFTIEVNPPAETVGVFENFDPKKGGSLKILRIQGGVFENFYVTVQEYTNKYTLYAYIHYIDDIFSRGVPENFDPKKGRSFKILIDRQNRFLPQVQ